MFLVDMDCIRLLLLGIIYLSKFRLGKVWGQHLLGNNNLDRKVMVSRFQYQLNNHNQVHMQDKRFVLLLDYTC